MSEDVSRVLNPLGKKGNRLIAILSFLILIALITPVQAIDYDDGAKYISGWDVADSGTDADLFTSAYDGESVFAFGAGGVILQSADKGATWVQLESPATSNLRTSDSVEGAIAVAGDGGAAYLRADGNETWLDISLTPPVDFRGMAMTSATSLIAVGPNGAIWQYSSETWIQRDSGVSTDLNEVSFLDATSGMIVGNSGTILATDDGGESWEYREAPEGLDADIVALDYYSKIRAYAITDEGHIVKSVGTNSGTAAGYVWELVEIESADRNTSLGLELNSIDVSSVNKFLVSGPSNYTALSLDGGNILTSQINPLSSTKDFNHVLFLNLFDAVIVGEDGVILFSENAGEDEAVGFFIIDYGDFGQFVDYSKEMLIDGLHATIRIVLFGMVLGFFLGIILSMMKTAPTTLKNVAQLDRFSIIRMILIPFCIIETAIPFIQLNKKSWSATRISERLRILSSTNTRPLNTLVLRVFGLGILYYGIMLISTLIPIVRSLNLDGWEYIYTPIGLISPDGINGDLYFGNFLQALLGIALILLGLLFLTTRKFFLKREVLLPFRGITVKWNFWDVRPMNAVATVYTDLFRNTPLLVQFLFIGVQFGKILGDPGAALLEGETNFVLVYIRDMILADRACVSSIFALGLNSGAYQCETIRGAIAAIPSGQMEAGRSIGLNYMQTMGLVIMPQAIRICIPPMGNEMVNLVLNSSLAMVVGYSELTRKGRLINAVTFQIFWAYGMVLVSYFVVTWTLALLLRRLETKSRIPGLGISGGT